LFKFQNFVLVALVLFIGLTHADAELRVVASIKPVHSLVASIMQGVGEPKLILDGSGTPHGYALKPSKARLLANADIIFWIGPGLETFMQRPVKTIGSAARSVELMNSSGLIVYPSRDFDQDEHSGETEKHDHGSFDPHIWLDPQNAKKMASTISAELIRSDPENADLYQKNTRNLVARLDELTDKTMMLLKPLKGRPFITHHDGYQYFEKRFGLSSKGALIANPEILPGVGHALKIRDSLKSIGSACLFTELQFPQKFVTVITENTNTKVALLDPLGSEIRPGPALYFKLMNVMAKSFHGCLSMIAN